MPRTIEVTTTVKTFHEIDEEGVNLAELRLQILGGISEEFEKDDALLTDKIDQAHNTALCDVETFVPDSGFQALKVSVEHQVVIHE